MKTAISVPDDVFARADALARKQGRSRSELYSTALREYLTRNEEDELTDRINAALALAEPDPELDAFVDRAADLTLRRVEW